MPRMSLALAVLLMAAPLESADPPLVERVEIQQNQFLRAETLLFYVSTKPGERYDELRLKDDFRRLWNTGFLDDLRVDVRDGSGRQDRDLHRAGAEARAGRGLPRAQGRLDERDRGPPQGEGRGAPPRRLLRPARARRVEAEIKALLVEKGRPFAAVRHEVKSLGGAAAGLVRRSTRARAPW